MPELTLWKREEMNRLRQDMGKLFARVWEDLGMPHIPSAAGGAPTSIEVFERGPHLVIQAYLPGMDPGHLDVQASEDILTVQATAQTEQVEEGGRIRRLESRYGEFTRQIRLPCRVDPDGATAVYKNGMLQIELPKQRPRDAREIKVRVE
ncbi:MAG: Hsp20/alpha crystallin family protein [Desulfobacteraceae bacterium]